MIKNYFKIAVRNILRHKLLSFVNIIGLAIGLTCVLLILLFVKDEWSFDQFHKQGDKMYRLVQTTTDIAGKVRRMGNTGLPHGPILASEIPEIETFCRIKGWDMTTKKGNEGIKAKVLFADASIFNMFSIAIVEGDPSKMLSGKQSIVLNTDAALKYFGDKNPIGKTIEIEVEETFETFIVTGLVKTLPLNSSVQFDMLIPFEHQLPYDIEVLNRQMSNWTSASLNTFFLLRKDANVKSVEQKIASVYLKHSGKNLEDYQNKIGKTQFQLALQPFFKMHLDKDFFVGHGLSHKGEAMYSYVLSALAVLILLVACINFVNIALARNIQRSKEIGIRKVSGSSRWQIMFQFLIESLVVTTLAFVLALFMTYLILPVFNSISNKQLSLNYLIQPTYTFIFLGLVLLVSFLAGFYPALITSGFKPSQALYSRVKLSGGNHFGKFLVIFQFTVAIALIIGTVIFSFQFKFISQADLGYNTEHLIYLQFPWDKPMELQRFKNELSKHQAILSVGTKSGNWNKTLYKVDGRNTDETYYEHIDDTYLQTIQIALAKGRYLSYSNVADTISSCMVNETFAKLYLDKNKDAIGQTISTTDGSFQYTIVGLVKDYHSADFKEKIQPISFFLDTKGDLLNTYIKYRPGKEKDVANTIKQVYKSLVPYSTLDVYYMQDWLLQRYKEDTQWKRIVSCAAVMAILIAALGLFALTTLSVQQRIKEIGIRKVLGASISNIVMLVSKDFLKLVGIATLIASPIAWSLGNKWLQDFAYHIDIVWWMYVIAGLIALGIAFITLSLQSIKVAMCSPIKSLRTE